MLELDDIQHFLLTRPPASAARYAFLSFREASQGRSWLAGLLDKVGSGGSVPLTNPPDSRWVTIAFTWNGLRALGVDDESLSTFPEEFRQGMVARAEVLGDTGANHPDHWVDGLARPDLHAIVILFARDVARTRTLRQRIRAICVRIYRSGADLHSRSGGDAAFRLCPRPFWLPRSTVAASGRRHRRHADARLGRCVEAGRVFPRVSRRGRVCRHRCRSRRSCLAMAAFSPTDGSRSTSAGSASSCGNRVRRAMSRNWLPRS